MLFHPTPRHLLLAAASCALLSGLSGAQTNERCTVSSAGVESNASTNRLDINASGRYVVFSTSADNLVPGDLNGASDVFVRDTQLGITQRLSLDAAGKEVSGSSIDPRISDSGVLTVFASDAPDLIVGDTNQERDIFRKDWQTGAVIRLNLTHLGGEGDDDAGSPDLDAGGKAVVYTSYATNMVPGDNNGEQDIFLRDIGQSKTLLVSQDSSGTIGNDSSRQPAISGDASAIAFVSDATNLVPGDTNGLADIFVHYPATGVTIRGSIDGAGVEADGWSDGPSLSFDGRYLCFRSTATNLVPGDTNGFGDIFVKDLITGAVELISYSSAGPAQTGANFSEISDDGRFVSFDSSSNNLAFFDSNNASDIFLHDRSFGVTTRSSVTIIGGESNGASFQPRISADGQRTVYWSFADNLASGDNNGVTDVYLADKYLGPGVDYCKAGKSASGCYADLYAAGTPSPNTAFVVHTTSVEGQKDGILFFGTNGSQASQWGNGSSYQCVVPPVRRTSIQNSGGTAGSCNGSFQLDFTDWINNHPNQQPAPGSAVFIQAWYRDPASTSNQTTSLSEGFRFHYRP